MRSQLLLSLACVGLVHCGATTSLDASVNTMPVDAAEAGTPDVTPVDVPACRAIGTRSEGWYRANGERICFANCAGAVLTCANVGTRSEGWYTNLPTAACSNPPVERLVQWTDCSP
jgi:hypothetical protein